MFARKSITVSCAECRNPSLLSTLGGVVTPDCLDNTRLFFGRGRKAAGDRKPRCLRNPYAGSRNSKSILDAAAGMNPAGKEAVMPDLAFVALGFAVIGLMGFYAFALRQL